MGKFNKGDFEVEVEEVIGVLKENDKNDWCKALARVSWNGNPATIDIRNFNMAKLQPMKGISLAEEEAERLTDLLIENDFGSLETLTKAVERKKSRFTVMADATSCFDDDEPYFIQINL